MSRAVGRMIDSKTFSSPNSPLNCLLGISNWMSHRDLGVILFPGCTFHEGQELSSVWHTMTFSEPQVVCSTDTQEMLIG